ncbi:hypothetical protein Tcur_1984 [Thermomonospora curvata DSM 43183]|uniref:Uncharacterized protein n=1 Tax=Thermomonospora curvata (strain ATCC 19995 / DSM 43183 / JCM 3096 / KCTC 9072 / NBRC 15933 / NCIMB 10081 / Henssen B9) TaxID=471852 RepID=D1ADU1_THECD|nr:hypothetical protein Tcur_1984 [Thermomonospora curvata DSM 43183]PKK14500.1 MAG: hypothetical protein BUE48_009675 [Thermomonospora sp. CIF 1]
MLCPTCRSVRPALSPAEYTPDRAYLITRHGLCVCSPDRRRPPRDPRQAAPAHRDPAETR